MLVSCVIFLFMTASAMYIIMCLVGVIYTGMFADDFYCFSRLLYVLLWTYIACALDRGDYYASITKCRIWAYWINGRISEIATSKNSDLELESVDLSVDSDIEQ